MEQGMRETHLNTRVLAWVSACLATSLLCTFAFACATPLAGIAAAVGLALPRREALSVVALTWFVNQAAGFLFLHYPLTPDCFAWGAAIGVASLAACLAAGTFAHAPKIVAHIAALLAAFVAYEALLYAVTPALGGSGAFTAEIVARIFAINGATFAALVVLRMVFAFAGLERRGVAALPSRA